MMSVSIHVMALSLDMLELVETNTNDYFSPVRSKEKVLIGLYYSTK